MTSCKVRQTYEYVKVILTFLPKLLGGVSSFKKDVVKGFRIHFAY